MWHWENVDWDAERALRMVEASVASGSEEYPQWRYPPLKPYLGYSGQQRVAAWQRIWVARRLGLMPAPTCCSICRRLTARGQYHNEDYSRPLDAKPVCPRCHFAVHLRFNAPERWNALVLTFATPGCWFENLKVPEMRHRSRTKRRDVR